MGENRKLPRRFNNQWLHRNRLALAVLSNSINYFVSLKSLWNAIPFVVISNWNTVVTKRSKRNKCVGIFASKSADSRQLCRRRRHRMSLWHSTVPTSMKKLAWCYSRCLKPGVARCQLCRQRRHRNLPLTQSSVTPVILRLALWFLSGFSSIDFCFIRSQPALFCISNITDMTMKLTV